MNGPLAVDTYQLLSCFADLEPKIAFSRVRKRSYCNCVFAIGPCQNRPARPPVKAATAAAAGPSCTVARGPDLRLLVFRTSTFCTAASLARHCTAKLHTTRWLSTAVQLLRKKMQNCIGRGSRRRRQRRRWRQRPTHVQSHMYHSPLETDSRQHKLFRCCNSKEGFFLRSYSYCFTPILRSCWLTNSFVNWLVAHILYQIYISQVI